MGLNEDRSFFAVLFAKVRKEAFSGLQIAQGLGQDQDLVLVLIAVFDLV